MTAVVTAFQPDEALVSVCASVIDQVDQVIVVDDGSAPASESVLTACVDLGARLIRQGSNQGIGAALNAGLAVAAPGAVLTLDQDSRVPTGYVAGLLAAADRAAAAGLRVAMVAPGRATGVRDTGGAARDGVVVAREPIQSGLLITAAARETLGGFDAELFIDGVDTEFWLRARAAGWVAIVAPDQAIEHRLGRVYRVRLLGRELPVGHAATFRYYFIARNRVIVLRRYARTEPGWALGAVLRDLRHLAIVTVLVPGRLPRVRATVAGLRDGGRGLGGPRPSAQPRVSR